LTINLKEKQINIENQYMISQIFGKLDENIDIIKQRLNVDIKIRDGHIKIYGEKEAVDLGESLIYSLKDIIKIQNKLDKQDLKYAIDLVLKGEGDKIKELLNQIICITARGKSIKPKTLGQKRYVDAISQNDIVFGIGPAGTGKTYLAMAMALQAFKNKEVNRIILTRLGFGSKAIITGDITQVDLPRGKESGLKTASEIFEGVKGIDIVKLSKLDIVRHPLVQKIIEAYEKLEAKS
jgi:phosphate starvation-inducible protein PhoH and related proteins